MAGGGKRIGRGGRIVRETAIAENQNSINV
jgi:hypothetical protein